LEIEVSQVASVPAAAESPPIKLTMTHWLIISMAVIGFAFDTYTLLMTPLIARPALAELLHVDPYTKGGYDQILAWLKDVLYASAVCGGVFGLLGGYLTDWFGRRRILTYSILLYAGSTLGSAFCTSAMALLVLRCLAFIGVCVEFVAAVAWLAELFPNAKQREAILGYTQAFSSLGGLMITGLWWVANTGYARTHLPGIMGDYSAWRWTLISGIIPALPLIFIRPFLPESPVWRMKKAAGTLARPSILELFRPRFRRTALVTSIIFACGFGAAFGAIQLTPQMVPGLVFSKAEQHEFAGLRAKFQHATNPEQAAGLKKRINEMQGQTQKTVARVQLWQEIGGLFGRFALAYLALWIISRRKLLWLFQLPGLIIIPLVYLFPAAGKLGDNSVLVLQIGMFLAGFFTIAQFSYWGNYLPLVYPTHLRGTGESFAANVGGRMIGTAANPLTVFLASALMVGVSDGSRPTGLAYAAALVVFGVYALGSVMTFFLPQPKEQAILE
jgi:MFS family permease